MVNIENKFFESNLKSVDGLKKFLGGDMRVKIPQLISNKYILLQHFSLNIIMFYYSIMMCSKKIKIFKKFNVYP